MQNILITGGTGFLGNHLIKHLTDLNHNVSVLSRSPGGQKRAFGWDVEKGIIDKEAFNNTDSIIHLAGAGIADHRWTQKYKDEILNSRVKSARLIFDAISNETSRPKTFISASAIGYYGETGDAWTDELFRSKEDFMGTICSEWEKAALRFEILGMRVIIIRIGLVLAKDGGVLPVFVKSVRLFTGAPLGNGKQFMSWIHINDLCRIFSFVLSQEKLHGVFNAAAPGPVTNKDMFKEIGKTLHRPIWPVNVPSFLLRMILGEKATIVLDGQRVSSEKIRMAGFEFKHPDLSKSLTDLLS